MDLDAFLRHLAVCAREFQWTVSPATLAIRGYRLGCWECPITAVARILRNRRISGAGYARELGQDLGLSAEDRQRLMRAADYKGEPALRRQLLGILAPGEVFPG